MFIGILLILVLIFLRSKDDLQKFQQNSYRIKRYSKWLTGKNNTFFKPHEWLYVLGAILFIFTPVVYLKVLGLFLILLDYYFFWLIKSATKSKLKLNVTARVKRMMFTNALILIFLFLGWYYAADASKTILELLIAGLYLGSFLLTMMSNLINMPLETQINDYYYKDAQKIMAKNPNLTVIGITGSYGKTSTKNVLYQILSKDFNVLMTPESFNTKMGLTRTIRTYLKPTHQILIAEMGAKEIGDIKELCDFVHPKIGIITSIGPQHLETFKTIENVISTKGELFKHLLPNGTAFVNVDDDHILKLPHREDLNYIHFSTNTNYADMMPLPDYAIEDVHLSGKGSSFTLVHVPSKKKVRLNTKLLGRHNLANIVSGVAVALELGVSMERLNTLIIDIKPVEHRLSYRCINDTYTLLDDAFNSNPIGSKMALEVLERFEGNSKIIITPGMIELGSESFALNKKFGEQIAKVCDFTILVGKKQTEPIQEGLIESQYPSSKLYIASDLSDALRKLDEIVSKDDVVLIENDLPDTFNEI
ncbi:UDP-N-acetylmuramoyl-tripeptide--D-alanyl-D-alanine ligase [Fusibacter ferrireducens]|uniref:UDP-N-acetylmuramoyl-tripeptide--D-alanyl-D-alanine ligase n=1 Tax=Fusibacter ferrireducens TaxID=2785058 RepID=A0ABR9ZVU8_9FIRM|nr:UDP-N-acetylmuramoyl-tripeptide--D-alanyl-D-alanine ligase [Fusibacter ferrireducens]MBF4694577.1 UDP-N-acetylmuramoyl-tripeptide--D-alanyl-D-alanine ligase [Fusibacter ferrireducens]